ncbi:MAG: 6-carboxytetrahydropterin synthase QueD [Oligoflexia bacterium]|nr:6-carboxytetrahydropterin synthase QueD [Oligoflexia bacterium]
MFELVVRQKFESAHTVEGHPGKCARLHGHNWVVDAFLWSETTNNIGIAADFTDLKAAVKEIVEPLDHVYLNDLEAFKGRENNPTAENVAKYIFKRLQNQFSQGMVKVKKVTIWETDGCGATYFE